MNLLIGIILSFTFLVVGFLLGNVFPVKALRGDGHAAEAGEDGTAQIMDEDGQANEEEMQSAVSAEDAPPRHGLRKSFRFWREEHSKKLVTQIGDELIDFGDDLQEDHRGLLSLLLVDLQAWIGLETQMKAAEEREAAKKVAPQSMERDDQGAQKSESPNLSINPVKMIRKGIEADGKLPADNNLVSIAAQIDEILQDSLLGSPLADRGIELEDVPGKGMIVHVGLDSYEGVAEVPDPEVQGIIRKAVAEWENRVSLI